jgi:hypothetical protein
MRLINKMVRLFAVLMLVLAYVTVLWLGLTEEHRRSLDLANSPPASHDFVIINVKVTSIDTAHGLLTERIRLVPMGRFAIDKNTPSVNLKLFVNSVAGNQALTFPKGVRIAPIDSTSLLSGNPNEYPFDSYTTDIDLVVTAPAKRPVPYLPEEDLDANDGPLADKSFIVGTNDLSHSETVPISEYFTASIPGIKFTGATTQDDTLKLTHTGLTIRRANNVIAVSVMVMTTMFLLAITVAAMVLHVTGSSEEMNLLPLSLCVTLIFGLPALRSIQPGVPGVGVLGDYVSFIWDEFIVSISAITLAWIWVIRSNRKDKAKQSPPEQ